MEPPAFSPGFQSDLASARLEPHARQVPAACLACEAGEAAGEGEAGEGEGRFRALVAVVLTALWASRFSNLAFLA
jgi:hypothetical protein